LKDRKGHDSVQRAVSRSTRLAAIGKALSPGYFVVERPDIPYLLAGPDVLASRPGDVLAIFIPSNDELADPRRLKSRVLLSRFVLPARAATLLVIPSDGRLAAANDDTLEMFSSRIDQTDLEHGGLGSVPIETKQPLPASLRSWMLSRASFLNALGREPEGARKLLRQVRPFQVKVRESPIAGAADIWRARFTRGASIESYGRAYLASETGRGSVRSLLAPYSAAFTSFTFWMHGEAVELAQPTLGAIYISNRPTVAISSRDRRGAALAGWALLDDRLPRTQSAEILNSWLERTL